MDSSTRTQIRLIVLVILAFLPAVLLYIFANGNLRQHEREQSEQELLQIAQVVGVEYQRLIEGSRQLLASLAEFPEIREAARPACEQRLASVLRHTPQYTTLSLIGLDGYLACGSLTVDGGLYLGDRAYYRLATTSGQFSVGNYALGRITGKPTVGVAYPIPASAGSAAGNVLAASIDLSLLSEGVQQMRIPAGATFTVLDRAGNVLVREPAGRNPMGYDSLGAEAPETFVAAPTELGPPYSAMATDLDGVDRVFAVMALRGSGDRVAGYLTVGREEATLMEDVESVARTELQFLALAGLGVLILAWLFGHFALVRQGAES